jgi:hypothetical protein
MEWNDVLHEGPTPDGLTFAEMNRVRAKFLSDQGWGGFESILGNLQQRREILVANGRFTLWFEEDLFDQLQILQILDSLACRKNLHISLVWIPHGVRSAQLRAFHAARRTIGEDLLEAGAAGWKAFCSPTPRPLLRFMKTEASKIPHLYQALERHLQEYPSTATGLSRNERQILEALQAGPATPLQVFASSQSKEESVYMGDSTFWLYMSRLSPLLDGFVPGETGNPVHLTPAGRNILAGNQDWVQLAGIDRWLGGVHLQGDSAGWRWDDATKSLIASTN